MCSSNLAVLTLSVYSAALRGGCSTVDCALCRQIDKRTLLLLIKCHFSHTLVQKTQKGLALNNTFFYIDRAFGKFSNQYVFTMTETKEHANKCTIKEHYIFM